MRRIALYMLLAVAFGLPPSAAQEPPAISGTLAPVYSPLAEQIAREFDLCEKRGVGIDLGSGPGT